MKIFLYQKKIIFEKLTDYGFKEQNGSMIYQTSIMNNMFTLSVSVDDKENIDTGLYDNETKEPYVLYKTGSEGSFSGKVRGEIENILTDISLHCCRDSVFKCRQSELIIEYIKDRYNTLPEFLWTKFPDYAVFRNQKNKKWYGFIGTVEGRKIGIDTDKRIEILNLHMDPRNKDEMLKRSGYFPAWHMNKKSWYTVILDGSIPDNELFKQIDDSYKLILKK